MSDLNIHRGARKQFSIDFVDQLGTGESLSSGTQDVTAHEGKGWSGTDRTADLIDGAATIDGTKVVFWVSPDGAMDLGYYAVIVKVQTNQSRTLYAKAAAARPFKINLIG